MTTGSPPNATVDQQRAEQAILRATDLNERWAIGPEIDPEEILTELADCLDSNALRAAIDVPSASSPNFATGRGETVQSAIFVAPSTRRVARAIKALERPDADDCTGEAVVTLVAQATEEEDPGIRDMFTGRIRGTPIPGDRFVGYRVSMLVRAESINVSLYADVYYVQRGRSAIVVFSLAPFTPQPLAETQRLVNAMLDRLQGV